MSTSAPAPRNITSSNTVTFGVKPKNPSPSAKVSTNCILVSRFLQIPKNHFELGEEDEHFADWRIVGNGLYEDRLWLDVRYEWTYRRHFTNGSGWTRTNCAAFLMLDPETGAWETVHYPASTAKAWIPDTSSPGMSVAAPGFIDGDSSGYFGAVLNEAIYMSGWNSLTRYDLKTKQRQVFPVPWQIPTQLFVVRERLLAANGESIFEIEDSGKHIRILASVRRRPAVTTLDEMESLAPFNLFPGPGGSVRALVADAVYSWDGRNWKKTLAATETKRFDVCEGGALFRISLNGKSPGLWLLPEASEELELCLAGPPPPINPFAKTINRPLPTSQPANPTWWSPLDFKLMEAVVTINHSNILVFAEAAYPTKQDGGRYIIGELEGRNANLVCLDRGQTNAAVVSLKFDLGRGDFSSKMWKFKLSSALRCDLTWLVVSTKFVLLGQDDLKGVWAFPVTELQAAIARERSLPKP